MEGFVVGIVLSVEKVPAKDKLKIVKVDIGSDELSIVTNAPNVVEGSRVVVAPIGCKVTINGEETEVKEAKVGGVSSQGMLCDPPMLGWTGGGAGNAALVPDTFEPGDAPPERRPRMDGKSDEAPAQEEVFDKNKAKEARKAASKAARDAKKAAKGGAAAGAAEAAGSGGEDD